MTSLRIGIGQINSRAGDFEGNVEKILEVASRARSHGVELLVFPEMCVSGYMVEDLAFRGSFLRECAESMDKIARGLARTDMLVIVGGIETGDALHDAAAVLYKGKSLGWARKRYLFCCGRFDETRYFSAGERPLLIETDWFRAAVTVGDDAGYPLWPTEIDLLVNLWNEPYHFGHRPVREGLMIERSREDAAAVVMVGPVGGQDDAIFEGSSTIVDGWGEVIARGKSFAEDLVMADLDLDELRSHRKRTYHSSRRAPRRVGKADRITLDFAPREKKKPAALDTRIEPLHKGQRELFSALVLATRDFACKNGFERVILGLSGGIDSALTAAVAREALGPENVTAVSMPGPYTSGETRADAKKTAKNLGLQFLEVPIKPCYNAAVKSFAKAFAGREADVTEENLQARLRGLTLTSLSNKLGAMVLATGNKSEAAVGYSTLYGDTCGAFSPLVDLYKRQVYEVAKWYNAKAGKDVIPQSVIERAPTAELRPNQKDQDTLPPYDDLDRVLEGFLEKGMSVEEMVAGGEDPAMVYTIMRMLMKAEFKRRQCPIGPTVSERALSDLRLPITKRLGWWRPENSQAAGKKGKKKPATRRVPKGCKLEK